MNGFRTADTATLETIRENLLHGLDLVADHVDAGTFHQVGAKGKAPPSESGQITLWMYDAVTEELARRTESATAMTTTTPAITLDHLFGTGCDCVDSPLTAAIDAGYVRTQDHPTLPLRIYNYTEKTAYEGAWTDVTRTCRGLIVDTQAGQVIARPYAKFMNYSQEGAAAIPLDAPVQVADKMDGSLAIVYPTGNGRYAVATRGSFASEQAVHATEVLHSRYGSWQPDPEWTALFEIIYPTNRIVCDYGDTDDLVFLGAVEIASGKVAGPDAARLMGWHGPCAEVFAARTLAEALALEPRLNAEGVVVRDVSTGAMLKIKQADYVELHRIVTGLTARSVWQWLIDGKPLGELVAPLPDEFHPWVEQVATGIKVRVHDEAWRLEEEYTKIRDAMPDAWQAGTREGRATFAKLAAPHPDKWAMFLLLDGRDVRPELLKRADPGPYITPSGRTFSEDNA